MNYRTFGNLGWKVSEISYGAWAIGGDMWGPQDDRESLLALHRALDLGVNVIDTAQGYGKGHSEELIGKVLRERKGDRLLLANYFLNLFSDEYKKRIRRFNAAAIAQIEAHDWPGNVREMRNRIQRAVIMSEGLAIEPDDLGFTPGAEAVADLPVSEVMTLRDARERLEKTMITAVLERNEGNVLKAAEELGVSRPTLYDLLKKYGMMIPSH